MARPVYTVLLGDAEINTPYNVIGGPWDDYVVVVTDVSLSAQDDSGSYAYVTGASDDGFIVDISKTTLAQDGFYWHGTQTLQPGDTLTAGTDSETLVYVRVTGWLLTPPSQPVTMARKAAKTLEQRLAQRRAPG